MLFEFRDCFLQAHLLGCKTNISLQAWACVGGTAVAAEGKFRVNLDTQILRLSKALGEIYPSFKTQRQLHELPSK